MNCWSYLRISFFSLVAILSFATAGLSVAEDSEIIIDTIVASVDGKPISLQDVGKRLNPPRVLSSNDLSKDIEARSALDALIMEKLIVLEADARKLGVSNSEIEEYINEVATRNKLTRGAFEAALAQEHKSLDEYKKDLKVDILRSKLTSNYVRGAVSVSDGEVDAYIKEHPQYSSDSAKLRLRQIILRSDKHTEEEAKKILQEALDKVKSGEDFANLAKTMSESGEAADGGSLGLVAESDLTSAIFDAVFSLNPGEVSSIVKSPAGYHIFKVEERLAPSKSGDDKDSKQTNPIKEEVRKILYDQKVQEKMSTFFVNDLYKLHVVDKKI